MIPEFYKDFSLAPKLIVLIVFISVGIFFLVKFCDLFVDSSSVLAKKLHISPMIIGLTVVAMGTSCPELAVSVSDSIDCLLNGGNANVALGNVIGSNICNIFLVLGISLCFTPVLISKLSIKKEFPILLFVTIVCAIFGIFFGINSITGNYAILRWEGIILVVLMFGYITFLIIDSKNSHTKAIFLPEIKEIKLCKSIIYIIIGAIGIAIGGELVVFGAKGLSITCADALKLNHDLTESLVGLTIVAVGTSLPELVTSVIAAKKGQKELALGNIIGSNIFNILFVLGISATVCPLTSGNEIFFDLIVMCFATILLFTLAFNQKIGKKTGILFLCLYCIYVSYLIIRTIGII